jgi:Cdc6-like AAA superfamily ATPase
MANVNYLSVKKNAWRYRKVLSDPLIPIIVDSANESSPDARTFLTSCSKNSAMVVIKKRTSRETGSDLRLKID